MNTWPENSRIKIKVWFGYGSWTYCQRTQDLRLKFGLVMVPKHVTRKNSRIKIKVWLGYGSWTHSQRTQELRYRFGMVMVHKHMTRELKT